MKSQSYMTRALRARDPRFARILGKLGYGSRDMQARPQEPTEDITALRAEYQKVVGKRPFHKWDVGTLKAKIAEAKAKG
ncbi:hypothetical protein [Chelativorans sp. J32]|uniref:hypothetical protein n=1 Tax=Chelativorans sp. J32 TaxID=935840 RepID=UPI0004896C2B|nr:hypothetical protein [Chelativorans sp. J32]